jgi:pimeloyl-ACP methyl ester carboxylesterase
MKIHDDLDQLALIRPEERDYNLKLSSPDWGAGLSGWSAKEVPARHFHRTIPVHVDGTVTKKLDEFIVPFPSAPLYGINRKAEYGKSLAKRPNMHSLRILRRPGTAPIHRLFILHNGLNETESLKFYYRLADWILSQQEQLSKAEGAACLIMPFPGHLMHSSFHGPFSETPLSRYLNDAGELFRQFLRYMIGMRWLLSSVTDSDAESWMVGGDLLDVGSRQSDLLAESTTLYEVSKKRLEKANEMLEHQAGIEADIDIGEVTTSAQIAASDCLLRWALQRDLPGAPRSLRVHVAGYSLGGFLAQSVFFTWPQVVSSCTTICSGGALSALSPTAFAQPEEWQSVLHALRPELSNSMLQGRLGDDQRTENVPVNTVAGMPLQRFGYFQRIFEQVFLQEDRSSYQERLSEYGLRMLFVSGGEDPIVPPANILDASPKEGTTMLSVAGMTHFLNQEPREERGRREIEQREFWLPEAGGLIARAAIHSEQIHLGERRAASSLMHKSARRSVLGVPPPHDSELLGSSDMFESALDWVLDAVGEGDGWLLICRNALPTAFIEPRHFIRWGSALHHHDLRIQQYALGLRQRARTLRLTKSRTTLILPTQLQHWFIDLSAQFDPHSDGPAGRMTTRKDRDAIWRTFERKWQPIIRCFEAGNIGDACTEQLLRDDSFPTVMAEWQQIDQKFLEVTHLPDVWIGIKAGARLIPAKAKRREDIHREIIDGVERVITDEVKRRSAPAGRKLSTPARKQLESDLEAEDVRVVQVSGAEFNPRYRGRIERSTKAVTRLLASCAAGLVRSWPIDQQDRE